MAKHQQRQKQHESSKLRTRGTLFQSKFTRSVYYKATNTLRALTYLEFENHKPALIKLCTPSQYFSDEEVLDYSIGTPCHFWYTAIKNSPYKGYSYIKRFYYVKDLLPKLARKVLTNSDFNEDWSLTEQGEELKKNLRKRWEHQVKIEGKSFYFCSSKQLILIILDSVEKTLNKLSKELIKKINTQMNNLLGNFELDGVCASGETLRPALGLQLLESHYGLMMDMRRELYAKDHEKKISNIIKKFSEAPFENLVSDDYLERMIGLAQTQIKEEC